MSSDLTLLGMYYVRILKCLTRYNFQQNNTSYLTRMGFANSTRNLLISQSFSFVLNLESNLIFVLPNLCLSFCTPYSSFDLSALAIGGPAMVPLPCL